MYIYIYICLFVLFQAIIQDHTESHKSMQTYVIFLNVDKFKPACCQKLYTRTIEFNVALRNFT